MSGAQARAIVQTGYGDTSVLRSEMVAVRAPGPGEVRIRQRAAGVNFHDIYVRTGLYQTLTPPGIPGVEAVGEIVQLGAGVTNWRVGQRVAYVDRHYGAYCEARVVAEHLLMEPPPGLPDAVVATALVRGLTVAMLLEQVHRLERGQICLIHAVAGGVGRLLAAWASHIGARVIGTAGARSVPPDIAAFCEKTYNYAEPDWAARLAADYGGRVDYVCNSVGATTFDASFDVVAPCGHVALFGQSSGKIAQIGVDRLAARSLTVTRPILFDYLAVTERRRLLMQSFAAMVEAAALAFPDPLLLPLDHAGEAQIMLEERRANVPIALTM